MVSRFFYLHKAKAVKQQISRKLKTFRLQVEHERSSEGKLWEYTCSEGFLGRLSFRLVKMTRVTLQLESRVCV